MPGLILTLLAPIVAWFRLRRDPARHSPAHSLETYLLWWLVLAVGAASVVAALFHIFDGRQIAEDIGFTRGDGGFQFENAMGDMAIGVAGLLCYRFRGNFWLAVLIVTAIQYYGDAIGHVYQWIENDNTEMDNVGIPLWLDVIVPTVGIALYGLHRRAEAKAKPCPVSMPRAA